MTVKCMGQLRSSVNTEEAQRPGLAGEMSGQHPQALHEGRDVTEWRSPENAVGENSTVKVTKQRHSDGFIILCQFILGKQGGFCETLNGESTHVEERPSIE